MTAGCLVLGVVVAALARPLARAAEASGGAVTGEEVPLPEQADPVLVWTVRLSGALIAVLGTAL